MSTGPPGVTVIRPHGAPRLSFGTGAVGGANAAAGTASAIARPAMPTTLRHRIETRDRANLLALPL